MEFDANFKLECKNYIETNFSVLSGRQIAKNLRIGKTTEEKWAKELGLYFKKNTVNENFFDEWTEESAYILGLIWTDGNLAWKEKNYNSITITAAAKDKEHLEKIRLKLQSTKPLLYGKSTNSYRLIIANKILCQKLMKLGLTPRKSLTVKFPKVPEEFLRAFIRGAIDGDGWVNYNDRKRSPFFSVGICSGSYDFILSLKNKIKEFLNIDAKLEVRKGVNNLYYLRYSCLRGKILAKWIYTDASLYLERKYFVYKNKVLEVETI